MSGAPSVPADGILSRNLRRRHVSMIAIGGVIGAGLFVGSSAAIHGVGPAVLLSYALAGLVALLVMRALAEMAAAEPGAGSFIGQIRRGVGPRAAFVAGWLYWLFWTVVVAAEAIGGSAIVGDWIAAPRLPTALLLVWAMAATNLVSVRAYGEFEFWFSGLKVAAIVGFCALCLAALAGLFGPGHASVAHLWTDGGFAPRGLAAVLAIVPTVVFQYTGAEISTVAALESDDPGRNVSRAANSVAARILLFYLLSVALILCVVPWTRLRSGHSPFVAAMDSLGIPGAATTMAIVVLVAVLSCLNSALYVTSRTVFELAGAGDAPAALVRTGRDGVPRRAVLLATALATAITAASVVSPDTVFAFLLNASGALILLVYALIVLAQLRTRAALAGAGRHPEHPMWLFPFLSWLCVAVIAAILVAMAFDRATRPQIELGALVVVIVWASHSFARRRRPPENAQHVADHSRPHAGA